jgi:MYXO-CTERM domain-containing protein
MTKCAVGAMLFGGTLGTAGLANASIVTSGVQSPQAVGTTAFTPYFGTNGFVAYANRDSGAPNYTPNYLLYGGFGTQSQGDGSNPRVTAFGVNGTGSAGEFKFQILGTAVSSTVRLAVNNSAGTVIGSTLGTLAYNATSGTGFGLEKTGDPGEYRVFILNGVSGASTGQGQFYNATGYVAFRFSTDVGVNWNYGWLKYTGGTDGNTGSWTEWAYNSTANASIQAGQVPAPGALALLGAAGLVGSRRRRA